jgi:hypothetical protein
MITSNWRCRVDERADDPVVTVYGSGSGWPNKIIKLPLLPLIVLAGPLRPRHAACIAASRDHWAMTSQPNLWRLIRWPILLLGVAGLGIGTATVLDRTAAREWALTIGAPSLTVLLPVSLLWLVAALVIYAVRRRRTSSR